MQQIATWVLLGYAVLMLVGGVIGYRTAASRPSLIAGVLSAAVLLGAYAWSLSNPSRGFLLAAVVAVLLAANFGLRLAKTGNFMPSGMLLIVSLAAAVILGFAAF